MTSAPESPLGRLVFRHAERAVDEALQDTRVVLVNGARRGFVDFPEPMVIDEIQRVPELLLAIKEQVDTDPRPGRFLLTGTESPDDPRLPTPARGFRRTCRAELPEEVPSTLGSGATVLAR